VIYLDYNATTPCLPEVVNKMLPYFTEKFGNASSNTYPLGWQADEAVKQARVAMAKIFNCEPNELIFTSGATESCNLAIKGVYERYATKGNTIITSPSEHKAVLATYEHLEKNGANCVWTKIDNNGRIDLEDLEQKINDKTILVSVMYANNETGILQDIQAIGEICRRRKTLLFCDATQAVGKLPIDLQVLPIDLMAFSAHKFYGPKGIGGLFVRRKNPRVSLTRIQDGGNQEHNLRAGTLNVPAIIGMAEALRISNDDLSTERIRLENLRYFFEVKLSQLGIPMFIVGDGAPRLCNTSSISFKGIKAEKILSKLNTEISFSLGSACNASDNKPSHVLSAYQLDTATIESTMRFSFGKYTTIEDVNKTVEYLKRAINSI